MRIARCCSTLAVALALTASARAQPSLTAESDTPRTTEPDPAEALPFALLARHAEPGGSAAMIGGYDGAAPTLTSRLEATIVDRIALRAGLASDSLVSKLHPDVGVTIDVLRGGLDLAVGADYQATGFNLVPAIVPRVTAGATVAGTRLAAQLAYGAGLQQGERFGDMQLTALRPVARRLAAGLASRLRVDLQSDPIEPVGERAWDVEAGPTATVALGRIAFGAMTGLSAWREHSGPARTGVIAELGAASTF